ncbi:hypothetical protein E3E31_03945 [Thermococcus sp. M39]|uniref:SLC13 family permease n=1 Tax=unclassified Thermococcus TaxID=2627626 RepID=UPI001439F0AA|nr:MULTISPECIES: SLC13 family permease [unclassified Thermococcus]NJE07683.1 hypothetical protein [Thermococcus sp. M39]NJE12239.1 hypothetical protein [Thermococcus sp. LS2]
MKRLLRKIIEEWIFSISLAGLVGTSLYLKRFPHYSYSDFKVIFTLFVFLVIVKGLEKNKVLKFLAWKFEKGRLISVKLVLLTAVLSMFMTNDVALITIVPLTLALNVGDVELLVILETIVANGASALTPFGNPQNIFLYYHYNVSPAAFIMTILPFAVFFTILALLLAFKIKDSSPIQSAKPLPNKEGYIYGIFFVLFVLAVLHVIPLWIGVVPIIYAFFTNREILNIDYFLLGTFIAFFGFTDNLMHVLTFSLDSPRNVFFTTAFLSQIMSNVPATLLLADFTPNWRALLWGASVGGFGTLIGSLANLISYRIYQTHKGQPKRYLIRFHIYSFTAFLLGILLYLIVCTC